MAEAARLKAIATGGKAGRKRKKEKKDTFMVDKQQEVCFGSSVDIASDPGYFLHHQQTIC
ncbi:MAG: hypothetical protein IPL55_07755 [Saprospiraceae bacterium]|nr:hypothetical protein [Saprospiraceae bacterium]